MKIEELAAKISDKHNLLLGYHSYGMECIRAGLKVALDLADEVQSEDGFHFELFDKRITAILEGRAELPEVE